MWKRIPTGGFKKTSCNCKTRNCRNLLNESRTGAEKEQKRAGERSRLQRLCRAGHCWEGQGPAFVASLAPRPAVRPLYPSRNTPSLSSPPHFLPLSTLIVFQSDKDLITREVDLEPEPLSERKRGPTSKKYFWKATVPRCCKGTLCLAIRTAALAFYVRVCPWVCCFSGV